MTEIHAGLRELVWAVVAARGVEEAEGVADAVMAELTPELERRDGEIARLEQRERSMRSSQRDAHERHRRALIEALGPYATEPELELISHIVDDVPRLRAERDTLSGLLRGMARRVGAVRRAGRKDRAMRQGWTRAQVEEIYELRRQIGALLGFTRHEYNPAKIQDQIRAHVAERDALRAQLDVARQRFTDTWRALDVEDKGGNAGFVEGALAARGLLQHVLDGLGWSVSEPQASSKINQILELAPSEWVITDIALDRTNFVWRRDAEGWRPVRNHRGVAYSEESIEEAVGPLLRLLVVPEETDDVGSVPAAVADRLRAEAALEDQVRAEAFDDVPHGECTDPPALSCSDAGCPEHGHDHDTDDEDELPEAFHDLVRASDAELDARIAVDPELERLRAILRDDTPPRVWIGPDPGADRALLVDAVRYVLKGRHASTTGIQRNVRVGFTKAGRLLDLMESWGLVGPKTGPMAREVLAPAEAVEDVVAAISNTEQEAER